MSVHLRRSFASALCLFLAACLTLEPVSPGKELSITLPDERPVPEMIVLRSTAATTDLAATAGGLTGAGAGFTAAWGCGFFVFLCAPVFMAIGGAAGGYSAGSVADLASEAPRRDSIGHLQQRLAAFGAANPIDIQFTKVLVDKAWPHWKIVPEPSLNALTVQPLGLTLRAESPQRITLEMRVIVAMKSETSAMVPTPFAAFTAGFWHESPSASIEQWMDEAFLKAAVDSACESIARQIVVALATPAAN